MRTEWSALYQYSMFPSLYRAGRVWRRTKAGTELWSFTMNYLSILCLYTWQADSELESDSGISVNLSQFDHETVSQVSRYYNPDL